MISKPLVIITSPDENKGAINVEGENINKTKIVCSSNFSSHLADGDLSNTAPIIVVNSTYLNVDNVLQNGDPSRNSNGVFIHDLHIDSGGYADYGVLFLGGNHSSSYKRLRIKNSVMSGFKNFGDFFLNVVEKVRVDGGKKGFDFNNGIKTSVKLDSCYSTSASDVAYDVSGTYMHMVNCCADGCRGTVFDLERYYGTVDTPGSESIQAKIIFRGASGTHVTINGPLTFGNFTDATATHISAEAGARMIFNGGRMLYDPTEQGRIAEGAFIKRGLQSVIRINNVRIEGYKVNNTYKGSTVRSTYDTPYGSIHTRHSDNLSFIGYDGEDTNGFVDNNSANPEVLGNAIYFGLGETVQTTTDGKDVLWHKPNVKGIFCYQEALKK